MTGPIPDRRGAEVDALSREGFAQPIKWQVLAKFRLQNGGEEMRPRPAAHDRVKGCGRLSDGLTTAAGEFLPHRLDDFPLPRDDFQRFGHILAEFHERAAAAGAGAW